MRLTFILLLVFSFPKDAIAALNVFTLELLQERLERPMQQEGSTTVDLREFEIGFEQPKSGIPRSLLLCCVNAVKPRAGCRYCRRYGAKGFGFARVKIVGERASVEELGSQFPPFGVGYRCRSGGLSTLSLAGSTVAIASR